MVFAKDPTSRSPFRYARVIGVYHVFVLCRGEEESRRVDFLHVRWFKRVEGNSSLASFEQERIRFVDEDEKNTGSWKPYGFLDPARIIRAVHLVPAFAYGELAEPTYSEFADVHPSNRNYDSYYVNK